MVHSLGQMVAITKETTPMTRKKEMVHTAGPMDESTKDNGRTVSNMG